ncbi:HEAT repeat domain-containing protein [Pseudomonas sp. NPDC089401]|uniref:HEAT repeat domain-containing protein n=1 Tax=Pseudomonas sp. NPDC089401 TaxID=3364462 RepID=UPI003814FA1F
MTTQNWLEWFQARHPAISRLRNWEDSYWLQLIARTAQNGAWVDLSRHENGFIREVAVRELAESPSPEALAALVIRLNDWVPQVREAATSAVQRYLASAHVTSLLFALNPLLALATQRRADHSAILASVRAALQSPSAREAVEASFLAQQSKAACYLFALLLESTASPEPLLRDGLSHRELNVRMAAIEACETLATAQTHALLLDALPHSIARVRICILRALIPVLEDPKPLLQQALLNGSGAVRSLAQWEAPRYGVDPAVMLATQLGRPMPVKKADWLAVLGLARDLGSVLPDAWWAAALGSAYPSVRLSALYLPGERPTAALIDALDDASDKVFNVLITRLGKLPWSAITEPVSARLDRLWHDLPMARRLKQLELLAPWQQVGYLLKRLGREPARQAEWLHVIAQWCDRQYRIIDSFTSKAEQVALKEQLQHLATQGLLGHATVARVAA